MDGAALALDEGLPGWAGWPSGWGGPVIAGRVLLGAAVGLGMVASVRFTAMPRLRLVPAVGFWRMTVLGGKSQLPDRVMVPVLSPALARVPWAW